jgi:hypothetical protein
VPATQLAAAVTDRYRGQVLAQSSATAAAVSGGLQQVDLDLSRSAIAAYMHRWASRSTTLITAAQGAAAGLSSVYVRSYLIASDAPVDVGESVDLTAHVGLARDTTVEALVAAAAKGLLWRLGQSVGRGSALSYGGALAKRAARVAVHDAARDTLTDLMVASPEIVGYRRVTATRTCGRCATAAERVYHAKVLLPRHPSCRCTQEPVLSTPARFARPAPAVVRP